MNPFLNLLGLVQRPAERRLDKEPALPATTGGHQSEEGRRLRLLEWFGGLKRTPEWMFRCFLDLRELQISCGSLGVLAVSVGISNKHMQ